MKEISVLLDRIDMFKGLLVILVFACGVGLGFAIGESEARWEALRNTVDCKTFIESSKSKTVKKDRYKFYHQCMEIQQGE